MRTQKSVNGNSPFFFVEAAVLGVCGGCPEIRRPMKQVKVPVCRLLLILWTTHDDITEKNYLTSIVPFDPSSYVSTITEEHSSLADRIRNEETEGRGTDVSNLDNERSRSVVCSFVLSLSQ